MAIRKKDFWRPLRTPLATFVVLPIFGVVLWHHALNITGVVQYRFELRPGEIARMKEAVLAAPKRVGVPVRIVIPSISVDAAIEKVALTDDGAMDTPKLPLDAGWYELGPRPGETGSAAIAGHVDWYDGETGVFADLHKLKSGDTIIVRDEEGADVSFVVRESRKYDAAADAKDIFGSNDGNAHLSIITCTGSWDTRAGQYTKRLVVFADKETR
jgi:sortase A